MQRRSFLTVAASFIASIFAFPSGSSPAKGELICGVAGRCLRDGQWWELVIETDQTQKHVAYLNSPMPRDVAQIISLTGTRVEVEKSCRLVFGDRIVFTPPHRLPSTPV